MTQNQTISKIADKFSINTIYARRLFHTASKEYMFEDIAKLIEEKPKPFVKWVGGKRQLLKQRVVLYDSLDNTLLSIISRESFHLYECISHLISPPYLLLP